MTKLIIDLLNPLIALAVCFITIAFTKDTSKYYAAKERLEKVYHPLFLHVEHNLYREISQDDVRRYVEYFSILSSKHSLLIYPSLRYWSNLLEKALNSTHEYSDTWTNICRYIDTDYDELCKLSHMPIRSPAYRLNNNQFQTKHRMWYYFFKLHFMELVFFLCVFILLIINANR